MKILEKTVPDEEKVVSGSQATMPDWAVSIGNMSWNRTGNWRYLRPRFQDKTPPCNEACPAGNDVQGFVALMAQGLFEEAIHRLLAENPFPGICGRICYHPCTLACNRGQMDQPVTIWALERFAADWAARAPYFADKPSVQSTGYRIAVIGAGPAGLSCAYHLARLGHSVTVYERSHEPGGMLRAIPEYRLPHSVMNREIQRVLSTGISLHTETEAGHDELPFLLRDFDAVFWATGAPVSRKMNIEGEDAIGIRSGLEFLFVVREKPERLSGQRAAIIGGGNTALDSARSAARLGAHSTIIYRRTRAEMPALEVEIQEAEEESIEFLFLASPLRAVVQDGRVRGLVCVKNRLGKPDTDGRRLPEPLADSEFTLDVDAVIVAVGETVDLMGLSNEVADSSGILRVDAYGATGRDRLWAGGDAVTFNRMVVHAIGSGKRGAIFIDAHLRGDDPVAVFNRVRVGEKDALSMRRYLGEIRPEDVSNYVVRFEDLNTDYFQEEEAQEMPLLPKNRRRTGFAEVALGYSEGMALEEAQRCLNCGVCNLCQNCYVYCPDMSIIKGQEGERFIIDYEHCKGCGICVEECPRSAILMEEER